MGVYHCDDDGCDAIHVSINGRYVLVEANEHNTDGTKYGVYSYLSPDKARAMAAELVKLADEIEVE